MYTSLYTPGRHIQGGIPPYTPGRHIQGGYHPGRHAGCKTSLYTTLGGMLGVHSPYYTHPGRHAGCTIPLLYPPWEACWVYYLSSFTTLGGMLGVLSSLYHPGRHAGCTIPLSMPPWVPCWVCTPPVHPWVYHGGYIPYYTLRYTMAGIHLPYYASLGTLLVYIRLYHRTRHSEQCVRWRREAALGSRGENVVGMRRIEPSFLPKVC